MDLRIITEDFPEIHINGSTIDGKLEAHRTNKVLDHPDGSVTWNKLGADRTHLVLLRTSQTAKQRAA